MALLLSLLIVMLVSILAAGLFTATRMGVLSSASYRSSVQAKYIAEGGARATIDWFVTNYSPVSANYQNDARPVLLNGSPVTLSAIAEYPANFPDSALASSFGTLLHERPLGQGAYSSRATLLSKSPAGEVWKITADGRVNGFSNAVSEVEVVIEIGTKPTYPYAVFATKPQCGAIVFSGGITDSFDSSQGSYAATVQTTLGNLGSNGEVKLSSGSTRINGVAYVPTPTSTKCSNGFGVATSGGAAVTEGASLLSNPPTFPDPPAVPSGATDLVYSGGVNNVSPGDYRDLRVSGGGRVNLAPGTYNIRSLVLSGGSVLALASPGRLVINISGDGNTASDLSGGGLYNPTGVPENLQFVYAGTGDFKLSGGSGSYAVLYAPKSKVTISGGGDWYGAMVVGTLTNSGGSSVHYDRSLKNSGTGDTPAVLSFNRKTF